MKILTLHIFPLLTCALLGVLIFSLPFCNAHALDSSENATHLLLSGESTLDTTSPLVEEPVQKIYTIVELSEHASKATVYIEALREETPFAYGSGFLIDPEGIIITNYHVLEGADEAFVSVGQKEYDNVVVLASSEQWDLAIIKINDQGLPSLPLGKGIDDVRLGETVLAVGNPEGLERTISSGIVSALRFEDTMGIRLIQTTAPISMGSSGGPLLNMRGEVIGVNTLTLTTGQNLNFAVPVDFAHELLEEKGTGESIAEVFSDGIAHSGNYHHQQGEFAVVLGWEGNFDLDLEIWSDDFVYLGDAFRLSDSPDILHGDDGEEWFVFSPHPSTEYPPQSDGISDFSSGTYVISPYFNAPETEQAAKATITVIFPEGGEVSISRELLYLPPYDQWFALRVDVETRRVEILDFFND